MCVDLKAKAVISFLQYAFAEETVMRIDKDCIGCSAFNVM